MIDTDLPGDCPHHLHEIHRLQSLLGEERRLREAAERAHEMLRDEFARVLSERDHFRRLLDEVTTPDARTRAWIEAALEGAPATLGVAR